MESPKLVVSSFILLLLVAACGSDDSGITSAAGGEVTTTVSASEPSDQTTLGTESTEGEDDGSESASGTNHGTVVLNGETKEFEGFSQAICDTDYLGTGVFNVHLTNTDGSTETMTLALYPDGDPDELSTLALLSVDVTWAGNHTLHEGSQVDSFDIDGNHAEGTATLISDSGEGPVSATFEVTCAG
jgi:hypothetical protein